MNGLNILLANYCVTLRLAACQEGLSPMKLVSITPPFFTSALDGSGQVHAPALPRGNSPRYPLDRRMQCGIEVHINLLKQGNHMCHPL
jgi:hypothetical protein